MSSTGMAHAAVLFTALSFASGLFACSRGAPPTPYSVRDSAGVRIVESQGPTWRAGEEWTLAPEPRLQIGQEGGDEALQFFQVAGGLRLEDGRIVILNGGSATVRVFGPEGRLTAEFGGQGDGPGEFRRLSSVHRLGSDTLLVWDGGRPGFSLFTAAGEFLGGHRLSPPGSEQLSDVHPFPGGTLIAETYAGPMTRGGDRTIGIHRDLAPLLSYSLDGELLDTLGFFPSTETMIMEMGGNTGVGPAPFGKSMHVEVEGRCIYVGTADQMEIQVLDLGGALRMVFRETGQDLRLDGEDREWYGESLAAMVTTPQEEQVLPMVLTALIFPETRAAYSDLKVDPEGAVWLRTGRHLPPSAPSPEWTVFSPEGALLGTVRLPDGFEPLEFGIDYVLGAWKDEMDVEHVRLYSLAAHRGGTN